MKSQKEDGVMMTVDTKRLRELADAVLSSKPDFCGGNWRTHYDYEKAANPQAIIALIDELESVKAQLAEANEALRYVFEYAQDADYLRERARQYLEKYKERKP